MKEVKIGIIGLGFMGSTHWRIYKEMKGAKIVALADVEVAKRKGDISKVVANIGGGDNSQALDLSGVAIYETGLELIADSSVDVVDICVPTPYHADLVCAALAAGKHVFCEKPLCRTSEELKRIVAAAKQAKGFLNVGLCVRAWPEYRAAWEYFKSGKAGKMLSATFKRISPNVDGNSWNNWYMDGKISGGALLDLHVHDTDQVNYFFGRPLSVSAKGSNVDSKNGGIDHVVTVYDYGDGRLVMAEGGWEQSKDAAFEMSFTIVCEKATLKLDAAGFNVFRNNGRKFAPKLSAKAGPTGWHQELSYFVSCVAKGVKPEKYQTIESVADSMAIVFAEEKSVAADGKKVKV
jgi:predicted dehydrogenase